MKIDTPFPEMKKSKKKMFATRLLLKSILYAFALLGLFFMIIIFSIVNILGKEKITSKPVPAKAILVMDFEKNFMETRTDDLFLDFAGMQSLSYFDLVKAINVAADDTRVKILVANINNVDLGLGQVQDLRNVIKNFRKKGKKAIAYSTGFGSFGGGTKAYYLASAFDEIWMQPNTEIGITGIRMEVPFFKGLLEKIGVEPEFYTRYEYKNAVASLVSEGFTKEHKEELIKLTESIFNQIVKDIAEDRNIEEKELREIIDNAPIFVGNEKGENKLIDVVEYAPVLVDKVNNETKAQAINIEEYTAYSNSLDAKNVPSIAFMVLEGVIADGYSKSNPVGESIVGSMTVIEQLGDILEDKSIKALVVRINSPGGSYTASNEIWYGINKIREDKKIPVIISMSDYAASGGYFVALSGDRIYAEPSTITGSIGVLGGKMVVSGFWDKLGVKWDAVSAGKNSGTLSINTKFSDAEREVFNRSLDNIYKDFSGKVSSIRQISDDDMNSIARGRVWTGIEAKDKNLVDEIGGIGEAIVKAKEMASISGNKYNIVYYPKKKTLQEKIAEVMNGGVSSVNTSSIMSEIGIDIEDLKLLKRLEYDAVLAPFKFSM